MKIWIKIDKIYSINIFNGLSTFVGKPFFYFVKRYFDVLRAVKTFFCRW